MATSGKVCILSEGEADELKSGRQIYCHQHKHISAEEAFGLTAPIFMQRNGKASEPVAEWVGPAHIKYVLQHSWRSVHRSRLPSMEFIRIKTRQMKAGFA